MSAYIHGSLAVDDRRNDNAQPERQRGIAKTVVRAKSLPTGEKLLYLFAVVVFCGVAALIAYRYAMTFELNSQMVKMEAEIRQLEEENAALRNEVAKLQEPMRLYEMGYQLGLVPQSELPAVAEAGRGGGAVAMNAAD